MIEFRKSTMADTPAMAEIAAQGKALLKSQGIPQWQKGTYPDKPRFDLDVELGIGYVLTLDEEVVAVCAVTFTEEAAYKKLETGAWLTPEGTVYATIHRSAVAAAHRGKHLSTALFEAVEQLAKENGAASIRVDTHPQNVTMQGALTRAGFTNCGTLILVDGAEAGDPRLGFEKRI